MVIVVQRVLNSSVKIVSEKEYFSFFDRNVSYGKVLDEQIDKELTDNPIAHIDYGMLLFIGFAKNDRENIFTKMVEKLVNLRIFPDDNGKMNKNICQIKGQILAVSQFTLTSNIKNGNRPSFDTCLEPDKAAVMFDKFVYVLKEKYAAVSTGAFGKHMLVSLTNDGPVTFILDSEQFSLR
jgi:D-tyrosyl-tRNA(Tyr) deacylase